MQTSLDSSSISNPHHVIHMPYSEGKEEISTEDNFKKFQSLFQEGIAGLNKAREALEKERQLSSLVASTDPSYFSSKSAFIYFTVIAAVWAAGQGCSVAGQQLGSPVLNAVGVALSVFGSAGLGGGIAIGGTVLSTTVAKATVKQVLLLQTKQP